MPSCHSLAATPGKGCQQSPWWARAGGWGRTEPAPEEDLVDHGELG